MTIARQPLAKHVPERYAVNKNRRQLIDNGLVTMVLRAYP
jgi:hypothetical protein